MSVKNPCLTVVLLIVTVVPVGCVGTSTKENRTSPSQKFSVRIEGGNRTFESGDEEVTFRLNYSVRGGNVTETDWGTIKSPPGSSVGVLDYDSYAEIRITGRGNYTIQLTATSADDEIARDTTKIVIE